MKIYLQIWVEKNQTERYIVCGPIYFKLTKSKRCLFVASAWRRSTKSEHEDDSANELVTSLRPSGRDELHYHDQTAAAYSGSATGGGVTGPSSNASTPTKQKPMSFKAASQATLTFLSARRRIEDSLKSFNKKRQSKRESIGDSEA